MTATEIDSDLEILNEIFNQDSLPCSYGDCQQEATHILVCAQCKIGKETLCAEHAQTLKQGAGPFDVILFNETCGHSPLILACPLLPI